MRDKEDFPPLFASGEHNVSTEELHRLCVKSFPLSETRSPIFHGFSRILADLKRLKIPAHLVVDGSFLTEEIDPDDIDFAVVVNHTYYDSLLEGSEQDLLLTWIRDDKTIKSTHLSDCYLCVEYPQDHEQWFDGIQDRAYWVRWYSKSVIYKRDRGVAIVGVEKHESATTSRR